MLTAYSIFNLVVNSESTSPALSAVSLLIYVVTKLVGFRNPGQHGLITGHGTSRKIPGQNRIFQPSSNPISFRLCGFWQAHI